MKGAKKMGLIVQCMRSVFNFRKSITPPPILKQPDHLNVDTYYTLIDSFTNAINQPDPEGKIVKLAKDLIAIYCTSSTNKLKSIFGPKSSGPNEQQNIKSDLEKKITEVFTENKNEEQDIIRFFECLKDALKDRYQEIIVEITEKNVRFQANNVESQENSGFDISQFLIIVKDLLTIFEKNEKVTKMKTGEPVLLKAENYKEELLKYYHGNVGSQENWL